MLLEHHTIVKLLVTFAPLLIKTACKNRLFTDYLALIGLDIKIATTATLHPVLQ
jgi:hypothetical protein